MEPKIIATYAKCRFSVEYQGRTLEPKLFCQLKSRVEARSGGYLRSCTAFTSESLTYQEVLANLTAPVLTEAEVISIQVLIADHCNNLGHCFNCHH